MRPVILAPGVPRPKAKESQHVHLVDLSHAPSVLEQQVVCGINVFRQRQARPGVLVSAAGFVGNSDSTDVVCVCTAMIAVDMSCMIRSAG